MIFINKRNIIKRLIFIRKVFLAYFPFCKVSRITAYCQVIFVLFYKYIEDDDIYNILFQLGVGGLALLFTLYFYVKKNPKCKFSLYIYAKLYTIILWEQFLKSFSKSNFNCEKAFEDYQYKRKKHYQNG